MCRSIPRSDRKSSTRAGSWRTSLIGTGARIKRCGGSITGCAHCQPRNCSTRELASPGLTFIESVGGTTKAPVHRYRFPPQDTDLRGDEDLRRVGGDRFGKVATISLEDRTIDIKKRQDTAGAHPEAVFAHQIVGAEVQADALVRIGEYVADHG